MIARRGLRASWIADTLAQPDHQEPDLTDPQLERSFRSIAEADGRVLRVVHRAEGGDIVVVTASFDRGARS